MCDLFVFRSSIVVKAVPTIYRGTPADVVTSFS
jgi:hypothetical protein